MRFFPDACEFRFPQAYTFHQGPHTCLSEIDGLKQGITENSFLLVFDMKCDGLKSCQPKLDKRLL